MVRNSQGLDRFAWSRMATERSGTQRAWPSKTATAGGAPLHARQGDSNVTSHVHNRQIDVRMSTDFDLAS